MSIVEHPQRRDRARAALQRGGVGLRAWPRPGAIVVASLLAVVLGMAANLGPVIAALIGIAATVATQVGVRRSRAPATPAAQWRPYSAALTRSTPAQLPPRKSTFRGREAELRLLRERHARWRKARTGAADQAGGPVLIFLHGMPGIGKTAVAQVLARDLADEYPDGQLYANLGVAGALRPPAEILRGFLPSLGWDEQRIPESTSERARLFRALTHGKHVLVLLDAARDPAQLRDLMPSESRCTVIVTSRRDMSPSFGAHSLPLGPLTRDDGLDLLAAVTGLGDTLDLRAASDIVDACGAHPTALLVAADLAGPGGAGLAGLAARLREPQDAAGVLTELLERPSRDLRGRLTSEYIRLNPDHQTAFRLLAMVGSRTFVPWVLGPAFEVKLPEAENLLAALASAQLVLPAGRDGVTGIDRYELPPIGLRLAQTLARPDDDLAGARARLDEGYLEAADRVLRELDPEFARGRSEPAGRWLPRDAMVAVRIAGSGQAKAWVRDEYGNLLRALRLAFSAGDHPLATRIAAWLGGCAPRGVPAADILEGFRLALLSADRLGDAARVDVLLARGAFHTAQERYTAAFDDFGRALALCHTGERADPGRFTSRRALVERRCGEAYLRAGELTAAAGRFDRARDLAAGTPDGTAMLPLIGALRQLAGPAGASEPPAAGPSGDDELGYWSALARSAAAAYRNEWEAARRELADAATAYRGDLRRAATIDHHLARIHLAEAHRTGRAAAARAAVRAAHSSLHDHRLLDDVPGQVRLHCLLASARLALGEREPAAAHVAAARKAREAADPWLSKVGSPLAATVLRAEAELSRHDGDAGAADRLRTAAIAFAANGDLHSVAEIAYLRGDHPDTLCQAAEAEAEAETAVRAYLEDGLPVTAGAEAVLRVAITAGQLARYRDAVTGGQVTVLVFAGNAEISPRGATVDLATVGTEVLLTFTLRARAAGPVALRVQLYALADGLLLQEFDAGVAPVAVAAGGPLDH